MSGKVFISHAHEDNARCKPLLDALKAWDVDYWFDTQSLRAGDRLSEDIQRAIAECDIFIRICTIAAQRSFWVERETGAFRALQARDHRLDLPAKRRLIPLRLDADYEFQPFELDTLYVDAVNKPEEEWLPELRRALIPARSSTTPDRPAPATTTSPSTSVPSESTPPAPAPTAEAVTIDEVREWAFSRRQRAIQAWILVGIVFFLNLVINQVLTHGCPDDTVSKGTCPTGAAYTVYGYTNGIFFWLLFCAIIAYGIRLIVRRSVRSAHTETIRAFRMGTVERAIQPWLWGSVLVAVSFSVVEYLAAPCAQSAIDAGTCLSGTTETIGGFAGLFGFAGLSLLIWGIWLFVRALAARRVSRNFMRRSRPAPRPERDYDYDAP